MRNGRSQLMAIILAVVIAFGFGMGGGVAGMYMVNKGYISLPGTETAEPARGGETAQLPAPQTSES